MVWRQAFLATSPSGFASCISSSKAFNDVYWELSTVQLPDRLLRNREMRLVSSIKSLYFHSTRPGIKPSEREKYFESATYEAHRCCEILGINSSSEFNDMLLKNGELQLLDWQSQNPRNELAVNVLDYDTKTMTTEFREWLDNVIQRKDKTNLSEKGVKDR